MHPTGKEYKTWGFYNMKGGEEEQTLRPWFYPYSLLCRLFPVGCTILETECTDNWGIRVLAMENDQDQISMVIVNNSDDDVTLTLLADGIQVVQTLYQYNYWEQDRPADENGFPVVKTVYEHADLGTGLHIEMPANGIVYFTTIQPNH